MTEETIFLAAVDMKDPAKRSADLDAVCAGNPVLRKQVEALLRSHDNPANILDRPISLTDQFDASTHEGELKPAPEKRVRESELATLGPARELGSLGSLGHYELLEVAGRGGMGVVFKARDTKLQRIVAIKILAGHLAADGMSRKRFVREAQAAAAIRDTHVVGIHAVNDEGAVPYLVMEFIDGVTLQAQIKAEGPSALQKILRIAMQAAEGLAAAHKQGLIHRDIKPANILLENHIQRVKITDFGLARVNDRVNLTQSGIIAGTPAYMAPEQTCGEPLDQRSDLFSLGSVLYFVCTGSTAFIAGNPMAIIKRVCEDTPTPIRRLNSEIPDWLAAIVDKLMAKDPKDRFQSAAEVAEIFREHLARSQHSGHMPVGPSAPTIRRWIGIATACVLSISMVSLLAWMGFSGFFNGPNGNAIANGKDATIKDKAPAPNPRPPRDPNVLTVSEKKEDGGEFRTINDALKKVGGAKKTIQVLDNAIYEEQVRFDNTEKHHGVILEAAEGKKPTLRVPPGKDPTYCVSIHHVSNVIIRGFRIDAGAGKREQLMDLVSVTGLNPGVVLDGLELTSHRSSRCNGISIWDLPSTAKDAPVMVQGCKLQVGIQGILVSSYGSKPTRVANVVIRNNLFTRCAEGVTVAGKVERILVVNNRVLDGEWTGIDVRDLLPGAQTVLVANNTLIGNERAFRVFDDSTLKNVGLKCKDMCFQNNLVLGPKQSIDMSFIDHKRSVFDGQDKGGDIKGLLDAWRFSHNWREISPPKADDPDVDYWIPGPKDTLQKPIEVISRKQGEPNFLRPPKISPLATAGADDAVLPAYVGAVPPEGVEPWNWDWTWDAFVHKRLTVSKNPADGGRFRTIGDALAKVEPSMTIRVLDGDVYKEQVKIDDAERLRGVVLEAARGKKPTIQMPADSYFCVAIKGVPDFKMRGLRFEAGSGKGDLVFVTGAATGVVLEDLEFVGASANGSDGGSAISLFKIPLSEAAAPIEIRKCTIRGRTHGILIDGMEATPSRDVPQPCSNIVIRENRITSCKHGVLIIGAPKRVHVVANVFLSNFASDILLGDLLPGAEDLLLANNTSYKALEAACASWIEAPKITRLRPRTSAFTTTWCSHPGGTAISCSSTSGQATPKSRGIRRRCWKRGGSATTGARSARLLPRP